MTFDWSGLLLVVLVFLGGIFFGLGSSLRLFKEFDDLESFGAALTQRRLLLFYILVPVMILAVVSLFAAD